ncbi:hypothetical protein BDD12DRAFT_845215 [Trichophaea hybrida]|nr:hypothetical protein BDD12DRAFT_845215 [Trichophaea hybrida]
MRPGPKPKDDNHSLKLAVSYLFPAVQQIGHQVKKFDPQLQLLIDKPELAELIGSITPAEQEKGQIKCGVCNKSFARNYHMMRHARSKATIDHEHAEFVKRVDEEKNRMDTEEPTKFHDETKTWYVG